MALVKTICAFMKGEKQEVFFARLNNATENLTGQALLDYQKKQWPA